jgi:cytochrome c oxidase accessory protein FixG
MAGVGEENLYQYDEEYRNHLATVDARGKRVWIYPKKPSGRYHRARAIVSAGLLALLLGGPFLSIGGQPLLLLNVFERRFVIFGQPFWPQDFILLAIALLTLFVFIILFTVVFGRVWCGWACPQTLFMEMVFRKIEYWIEGDANHQRILDRGPWTASKFAKKTSKHLIFLAISLIISHTVLAYLIGIDETILIVTQPPSAHLAGFTGLMAFTGIFYGVFARFREQACVAVCPYGRLQGVLLGKDSIVVAYDFLRGEPRTRWRKGDREAQSGRSDCIDCKLCVHVCPTGIDIRNGTQLECVNCTACMDACDHVMEKVGRPKGLIRYSSLTAIREGTQRLFTSRVFGYSVVLTALLALLSFMVFTRSDIETTVLKVPGTLFQTDAEGHITNLYNIEFVNKTFDPIELQLKVLTPRGAVLERVSGAEGPVPPNGLLKGMYLVKMNKEDITSARITVEIGLFEGTRFVESVNTKFIGPVSARRP